MKKNTSFSTLLFVAIVSLFFYACNFGTIGKVTKPNKGKDETLDEIESYVVYNPQTGKYDTILIVQGKVDTVRWKNPTTKVNPPINNNQKPGTTTTHSNEPATPSNTTTTTNNIPSNNPNRIPSMPTRRIKLDVPRDTKFKDAYNVSYLLPFYTDKYNETGQFSEKSDWAINFYAGAKIAIDSLKREGISLNVNVFDSKANETEVANLLKNKALQDADLIIGGETKANVTQLATFAKQKGKIYISPYNTTDELVSENPQMIQISPSLQTHCEAIVKQLRSKNISPEQVTVLCRNKPSEMDALQYLQNAISTQSGGQKFREVILGETVNDADIRAGLRGAGQATVFIVPIWTSETLIYTLLRKIEAVRGKNDVTVYGMPQWYNFATNGADAFEPLKVHITTANYTEKDTPWSLNFQRQYFKIFNNAPTAEAYLGYDLTLYMGRMAADYGTKFNKALVGSGEKTLHTGFFFEGITPLGTTSDYNQTSRYANKYVNILKFQGGYFQPDN